MQRTKGFTVVASSGRPRYLCRVSPFVWPLAADWPTVIPPEAVPTLNSDTVRSAFAFLVEEYGFERPRQSFEGTDLTFAFQKGGDEVIVLAEDMGSNFPFAFIRHADGSVVDLDRVARADYGQDLRAGYPAHEAIWKTWWPLSLWSRRRRRGELQEEVGQRVGRLASFVGAHYGELFRNAEKAV